MSQKEKKQLSFEEKASEYKNKVLRLGRHVKVSDNLLFSNGECMGWWLFNQNNRLNNKLKEIQNLPDDIKKQVEILKDIYSLITMPKRLTFEEKAIEYHNKIYDLGRSVTKEDHICFSDQSSMGNWFEKQVFDYYKNFKKYPGKYRKRLSILVSLYESIENLNQEKYEHYVSKTKS